MLDSWFGLVVSGLFEKGLSVTVTRDAGCAMFRVGDGEASYFTGFQLGQLQEDGSIKLDMSKRSWVNDLERLLQGFAAAKRLRAQEKEAGRAR